MSEISVAIADDNERILDLLGEIVENDRELHLVGKANNGEDAYRIIREKQPELPIILMSKCDIWTYKNRRDDEERRSIIRDTYEHAVASGDRNVYFVDGETLFGRSHRSWCTVDTCHPNDLGFFRMFEHTLPVLEEALKKYR